MSSILAWEGGSCGLSANEYNCVYRSPNKIWRSTGTPYLTYSSHPLGDVNKGLTIRIRISKKHKKSSKKYRMCYNKAALSFKAFMKYKVRTALERLYL
jgi:hypothetical protein